MMREFDYSDKEFYSNLGLFGEISEESRRILIISLLRIITNSSLIVERALLTIRKILVDRDEVGFEIDVFMI